MSEEHLERQRDLPPHIHLFRHNPQRQPFSWESWQPSKVKAPNDLPPYLILGRLSADAFEVSSAGWSARWLGSEPDTYFGVRYLAEQNRYEIDQVWRGVSGGYASASAQSRLDTVIAKTLYLKFPSSWDTRAKSALEGTYQIRWIEQPENSVTATFIPDGAFRVVAFPVAVANLRPLRDWFQNIAIVGDIDYPVSADATLLFQAINYVEGKSPEWSQSKLELFKLSLSDTGIMPHDFTVRETSDDGSAA